MAITHKNDAGDVLEFTPYLRVPRARYTTAYTYPALR